MTSLVIQIGGNAPGTAAFPSHVEEWPVFDEDVSLEASNNRLMALGLGDGLPVIPPTAGRLERMLASVAEPEESYGTVEPLHGTLTPWAVAYQAVMAGCEPEWLDVVFSAALACREPEFNLLGALTTTGSAGVAVILHGAAAAGVGTSSGSNCLGPGNRANASIGRAVALTLKNVGGAMPGVTDMATMGQPGKYTLCFGEAPADPSFPSLHVRRGFAEEDAAVTVVCQTGTVEVVAALVSSADSIASIIAGSMQILGALPPTPARMKGGGEQFILTPPEVADVFRRAGWTLSDAQEAIFERSRFPWERLPDEHLKQLVEVLPEDADGPGGIPVAGSPADIHMVVTGGTGAKMTFLPSWSGETTSVTRPVIDLKSAT